MNYTGRPSISGCRPVLSLYPTHCFCQYLLRIFITFTNSSLFTRAFSTNSRRALSHAAGVTAAGCALSGASRQLPQRGRSSTSPSALTRCHCPGCGSQRLLRCRSHPAGRGPNSSSLFPPLAAVVAVAPTEGRPWQAPQSERFRQRLPYQGSWRAQARLRGCTKESLTVSTKKDPLSEIAAPGEGLSFWVSQWTHLLPPLSLLLYAILRKSQALCGKFTVTLLLASPVSFWRIICYNGFAA